MPAHGQLARETKKSYQSGWPALLLVCMLIPSSPARTETIVNCSEVGEYIAASAQCDVVDRSPGKVASPATGPVAMPASSPARHTPEPRAGKIWHEIGKQTIDQPGHFLIGAAPIWASRYLVGVPWYGWVITPLLAYREWLQWPSKRWWDPPLDWIFLSLGTVVATWRRSTRRSHDERRIARRWPWRPTWRRHAV